MGSEEQRQGAQPRGGISSSEKRGGHRPAGLGHTVGWESRIKSHWHRGRGVGGMEGFTDLPSASLSGS